MGRFGEIAAVILCIGIPCFIAYKLGILEPVLGCVRSAAWPRSLVWAHVIGDAAYAIAYTWIPLELLRVYRARKDMRFTWILGCFCGFIAFCGIGHVLDIVTVWNPLYWLSATNKHIGGAVSLVTAYLLSTRVAPALIAIPTGDDYKAALDAATKARAELAEANARLAAQNTSLESRAVVLAASNVDLSAQADELRAALEKIRVQGEQLRELSVPVLELDDERGVLLVPIVGMLDSARASELLERVGAEIASRRARSVLIDLTGVPVVDTAVAAAIVRATGMIRLLGAECVLTGIRPAVAQAIVSIDVDLKAPTLGTIAHGLRYVTGVDVSPQKRQL